MVITNPEPRPGQGLNRGDESFSQLAPVGRRAEEGRSDDGYE